MQRRGRCEEAVCMMSYSRPVRDHSPRTRRYDRVHSLMGFDRSPSRRQWEMEATGGRPVVGRRSGWAERFELAELKSDWSPNLSLCGANFSHPCNESSRLARSQAPSGTERQVWQQLRPCGGGRSSSCGLIQASRTARGTRCLCMWRSLSIIISRSGCLHRAPPWTSFPSWGHSWV